LVGLLSWLNLSWCIGGDFNAARFSTEILGGACSSVMVGFSDFIFVQGLMNLPLVRGLFYGLIIRTPVLGQEFIGFLFLRNRKLSISVYLRKRLRRLCSDYLLILLDCGGIQGGQKDIFSLRICG
jgi:hypothetical protein